MKGVPCGKVTLNGKGDKIVGIAKISWVLVKPKPHIYSNSADDEDEEGYLQKLGGSNGGERREYG
jgi:hypothetical protein